MEQMDLFELSARDEANKEDEALYLEWCALPFTTFGAAGGLVRENLAATLRTKWKLYQKAYHICPKMPPDMYIWLNEVEPAEFWAMNHVGQVCGEKVDVCPFCRADLKNRGGDVLLFKTDSRYWEHRGFMEQGGDNDG